MMNFGLFRSLENYSSSDCESLIDIEEPIHSVVPLAKVKKQLKRIDAPVAVRRRSPSPRPIRPNRKRPQKRRQQVEKEADERIGDKGQHPLQNDLILDSLMSYLPLKTLKVCRVVNKHWKRHATKYMRKYHPVITFHQFSNFMDGLRYTSEFPFTRFQIDSSSDSRVIPEFLKRFGSNVKHLIVSYQNRRRGSNTLDSAQLQLIMSTIKNVEILELNCLPGNLTDKPLFRSGRHIKLEKKLHSLKTLRFDEDDEIRYSVGFLEELFFISPNCERVQLMLFDPVTISRFFTSMRVMANHLVQLEIQNRITERQVELFCQIGLQLKDLHLENVELKNNIKCVIALLEQQSVTLETLFLCVEARSGGQFQPENISLMPKLKHLSLYLPLNVGSQRTTQFPLLCNDPFQNQLPRLTTLRTSSEVFIQFFSESSDTYPTVKNLNIKITECDEGKLVKNIARFFPNIKQMWIGLCWAKSGDGLSVTFQFLQNLEELHVEYCGFLNVNRLISGIQNSHPPGEQHSIRHMTKLRNLYISSTNCKISELSVNLGFLQMHRLGKLTLRNLSMKASDVVAQLEARHETVCILSS